MRKARTPVNFPRMKVRGARNKRKMARRKITYSARVLPTQNPDGSVSFSVDPGGTHIIQTHYYQDGWGRTFRMER